MGRREDRVDVMASKDPIHFKADDLPLEKNLRMSEVEDAQVFGFGL